MVVIHFNLNCLSNGIYFLTHTILLISFYLFEDISGQALILFLTTWWIDYNRALTNMEHSHPPWNIEMADHKRVKSETYMRHVKY